MELYIDDMLVNSLKAEQYLEHLGHAFDIMRKYNINLNPTMCNFGVSSGKCIGYMVIRRRIEATPDQIKSILDIPSLTCPKDVMRLVCRVAVMNKIIYKSTDKCFLFSLP